MRAGRALPGEVSEPFSPSGEAVAKVHGLICQQAQDPGLTARTLSSVSRAGDSSDCKTFHGLWRILSKKVNMTPWLYEQHILMSWAVMEGQ